MIEVLTKYFSAQEKKQILDYELFFTSRLFWSNVFGLLPFM